MTDLFVNIKCLTTRTLYLQCRLCLFPCVALPAVCLGSQSCQNAIMHQECSECNQNQCCILNDGIHMRQLVLPALA